MDSEVHTKAGPCADCGADVTKRYLICHDTRALRRKTGVADWKGTWWP